MKTPAFIPLALFLLLAAYALAAPPPPLPKAKKARTAAVVARTECPKCHHSPNRLDSVTTLTNLISDGVNAPRRSAEQFNFKCPKCGEKFRKIEVLPPSPPMPPGLPARSPADKR